MGNFSQLDLLIAFDENFYLFIDYLIFDLEHHLKIDRQMSPLKLIRVIELLL